MSETSRLNLRAVNLQANFCFGNNLPPNRIQDKLCPLGFILQHMVKLLIEALQLPVLQKRCCAALSNFFHSLSNFSSYCEINSINESNIIIGLFILEFQKIKLIVLLNL